MRDTVTVIHWTSQGTPDYLMLLTLDFVKEGAEWSGVCLELGTAASSCTLEQVREELHEAVELQLNEMERLCSIDEYLEYNHVHVVPINPDACPEEAGFSVAANSA